MKELSKLLDKFYFDCISIHSVPVCSEVAKILSLHCALAAAQCIVIGPVCVFVGVFVCLWQAGGRAVSAPYSQRARSVCVSLSAFFIVINFFLA